MPTRGRSPLRVLLSYTTELRSFPARRSFVAAAEHAVTRTGNLLADLAYFSARGEQPAEISRREVASADILVLIAGFRYGSVVTDRPDFSYPELQWRIATELGIPRLAYILSETVEGPASAFLDPLNSSRQIAFRTRLLNSEEAAALIHSPDMLESALSEAMLNLHHGPGDASANTFSTPDLPRNLFRAPTRLRSFVGREKLLSNIRSSLRDSGGITVLTGVGGVGKTATAVEFAHRYSDTYDLIWWIDAADPSNISASFSELANTLGLGQPNTSIAEATLILSQALRSTPNWLIILDNAASPRELKDYLVASHKTGHYLVTSRNLEWRSLSEVAVVDVLNRTESTNFLQNQLPGYDEADLAKLAGELGYLPLALNLAASMLATTGMSISEYRSLLKSRTLSERIDAGYDKARPSIAPLSIILNILEREEPDALDLLTLLSFFSSEPIPLWVLGNAATIYPQNLKALTSDPIELTNALMVLKKYGVAGTTSSSVQLHRLISTATKAHHADGSSKSRRWLELAIRTLRLALLDQPSDLNASQWGELLPHLLAVAEADPPSEDVEADVSWLLRGASSYLASRGEQQSAVDIARRSYRIEQRRNGESYPATLAAAANLGHILLQAGNATEAMTLLRDVWARQRKILGDNSPEALSSAILLVDALLQSGLFDEAVDLATENHAGLQQLLGPEHPATLQSADRLALASFSIGQFERSLTLLRESTEKRINALGPDHPTTLSTASNQAIALQALGRTSEAIALEEDTLLRRRRTLGSDSPDTLTSQARLADLLASGGSTERAHSLAEDVYKRRRDSLGTSHPDFLQAASNLASMLSALGRVKDALQIDRETLVRRRQVFGSDHPDTLQSANNVAADLRSLGRYAEALELDRETHERRTNMLGMDHPETLRSANNLAIDLYEMGEYREARRLDEDTLTKSMRVLGAQHPETADSARNLARDLLALGEKDAAQALIAEFDGNPE